MMTDPIADMLTRVRNGLQARHERVEMPSSGIKCEIARVLKEEGYIRDYEMRAEGHPQGILDVELKYDFRNESAIRLLKRMSTPGKRQYVRCKEMPIILGGSGIAIVSTSRGLLTDRQCRAANVGGEVICHVW